MLFSMEYSISSDLGVTYMGILKRLYNWLYRMNDIAYYWKIRQKAIECKSKLKRNIYLMKLSKIHSRFNASIPLYTKFASMPHFVHGLNGILISCGAQIGSNCVIFHQVTIGSNTSKDSNEGAPIIGDNVYIGAGAKVIGNVRVGNNVRIGANCVVVTNIPDNATVVLQAPRIIEHDEKRDNAFYRYAQQKEGLQ